MRDAWKRAGEILLLVGILALSVLIFLYRERLQGLGSLGYLGVFGLCFLANATVFLPAPSLLVAAGAALILNPWLVALTAALGASLGELAGYLLGHAGRELSPRFRALLERLAGKLRHESAWVFLLALLPLPLFDFAGVFSGGRRMKLWKFLLACFLGKLLKMLFYTQAYGILEQLGVFLKG